MGNELDYKEELKKSFRIATIGAAVCAFSFIIFLILFLGSSDSDVDFLDWFRIIGLFVLGGGLVSAGSKLCAMGHKETGVTSAGGGMILAGVVQAVLLLFVSEESQAIGTSSYICAALNLLGFVIGYYALKQDGKKEDKFFDMAAYGFGIIAGVNIIFFVLVKLMVNVDPDPEIMINNDYIVAYKEPGLTTKIAIWTAEHLKLVISVYFGAIALGYLLMCVSFGNYSDFIKDIKEEEKEEEKEKVIDEALAEYKKRHSADTPASDDETK